jgi:hypothetical protein
MGEYSLRRIRLLKANLEVGGGGDDDDDHLNCTYSFEKYE